MLIFFCYFHIFIYLFWRKFQIICYATSQVYAFSDLKKCIFCWIYSFVVFVSRYSGFTSVLIHSFLQTRRTTAFASTSFYSMQPLLFPPITPFLHIINNCRTSYFLLCVRLYYIPNKVHLTVCPKQLTILFLIHLNNFLFPLFFQDLLISCFICRTCWQALRR